MKTLALPRLTVLRRRVTELLDLGLSGKQGRAEVNALINRNDPVRRSNDYHGPDPSLIAATVADRLRAHGVPVTISDAAVNATRDTPLVTGDSIVWGSTSLSTGAVVVRDSQSPQGQLLTLAHEGCHALTRRALTLTAPFVDNYLTRSHGYPLDYIVREVAAESTAYLVGQATGTDWDLDLHAAYIAGYLAPLVDLGAPPDLLDEIWTRASRQAHQSAAVMLGDDR